MRKWQRRFTGWLRDRFFLRFHMSLILAGTFLAGLLATKILLALELNRLWLRYAVAVVFAYGCFLILIRVWLWYIGFSARRSGDDGSDLPVEILDLVSDAGSFGGSGLDGGGGKFGGGGATGSYDAPPAAMARVAPLRGGGGGSGGGFSIDADEAVVVVLIAALVLSLFVVSGYLIYAAPGILAEAAFEALLAAALLRRAKRVDSAGWVGSIVKATALPFLVIFALSVALGWYAQKACPSATKIREAIACGSAPAAATPPRSAGAGR